MLPLCLLFPLRFAIFGFLLRYNPSGSFRLLLIPIQRKSNDKMAWRSQTSDTASENNFNLYENLPPSPSLFSAQDDSLQLEGLENDFQVLRLSTTTTSPSEDVKYKPIPPLWGPNNLRTSHYSAS